MPTPHIIQEADARVLRVVLLAPHIAKIHRTTLVAVVQVLHVVQPVQLIAKIPQIIQEEGVPVHHVAQIVPGSVQQLVLKLVPTIVLDNVEMAAPVIVEMAVKTHVLVAADVNVAYLVVAHVVVNVHRGVRLSVSISRKAAAEAVVPVHAA